MKETVIEIFEKLAKDEGLEVLRNEVRKVNVGVVSAVSVRKPGQSLGVNLYVDAFIEDSKSADEAADKLLKAAIKELKEIPFKEEVCKELKTENVVYSLVNWEKNKAFENALCQRWFDLLFVPIVCVHQENDGRGIIRVTEQLIERLGITDLEGFKKQIVQNTLRKSPVKISTMGSVLVELGLVSKDFDLKMLESSKEFLGNEMLVVRNELEVEGAATAVLSDAIPRIAMMHAKDVVVLPSSLHEVIVTPIKEDLEEMIRIVMEINRTQVDEKDFLSDSIYVFERENERYKRYYLNEEGRLCSEDQRNCPW